MLSKLKEELGLRQLTLKFLQLLIVESRIGSLIGVLDSFETLYNDAINLQVQPRGSRALCVGVAVCKYQLPP